jgi:nucleoside-diphosphate-sugar epimerase
MNKKKILIFGSNGFIGSNLINKISKKKYSVTKVNRKKFISLNLKKRLNLFKKCDFIFHLANQNNEQIAINNPIKDYRNNINLTLKILETIKNSTFKPYLIYPSTVSLYKSTNLTRKENSKKNIISIYNAHKLINEIYIKFYYKRFKVKYIILRISNVYGFNKKNNRGLLQNLIFSILKNKDITLFNRGLQYRDYLYIDDVIEGFLKILINPQIGVFNLCSGKSYNFIEINKIIKNVLKIKYKTISKSKIVFKNNSEDLFNRNFIGSSSLFKKKYLWENKINLRKGIIKVINQIKV